MRYWYLKGGDVVGPLSVQEIAKDSDFSAEILVCPEPNSGDETFWKTPSMYAEDFGPFIKTEPAVEDTPVAPAVAKTVVKEVKVAAAATAPAAKTVVKAAPVVSKAAAPVKKEEPALSLAALEAVSPEETIHSQSPLNAPLENNLLEELPAKAVLAAEEPKAQQTPQAVKEVKKDEEKPHPVDPLIAVIENQKPLQSFREEDFTLVSSDKAESKASAKPANKSEKEGTIFSQKQEQAAPVVIRPLGANPAQKAKAAVKKQVPQAAPALAEHSAKTPLPVETFSAGSGVVHIKQDGEEVPSPEEQIKEQARSKEKSFFSAMAEEKPANHTAEETDAPFPFGGEMKTAEISQLITEEPSSPFLQVKEQKPRASGALQEEEPLIPASAGDRLAGGIMPTTNGKIISSSDGRLEDKKPKNDVIYLLVISMFLFTGIALFMTFFGDKKDDKKAAPAALPSQSQTATQDSKPVLQGVAEGVVSPEAQQPSEAVKTPDIMHEKGSIVQQDAEANKTKSQDIVKKYLLDEQRGTIGDFLNTTYGGGAYQMSWSSSPLYADTYVVDFTASKVRAEPIVYLFRVDIKKGVVTGGLNGITMDLLAVK